MAEKIGNVKLEGKAILAPMAGVNCASFRLLCRENGAAMVSTPMLVANQLVNAQEKIVERTCYLKEEQPIMTQLVGSDSKLMAEATQMIDEYSDIIDVNLGCPEKQILALKAGSFLVKHPEQIKKSVKPVIDNTNKPVTAKIRIGWDEKTINTLETVKILEDLGVTAITIHARTKAQGYSGKADWKEIKKAKEKSNVIIIGNGDVTSGTTAKKMIEMTGCDFVMVGRAAMGNPLIFKEINDYLLNGTITNFSDEEKLDVMKQFMQYYDKHEQLRAFSELRQQVMWFTKGMRGSKTIRRGLMETKTLEEIKKLVLAARE